MKSLVSKVEGFAVGDRVAYGAGPLGAYAQARNITAERLVKIPDEISDREAAAMMLKGMTAEYLICRTYQVKAGETILVHAGIRRCRTDSLPMGIRNRRHGDRYRWQCGKSG